MCCVTEDVWWDRMTIRSCPRPRTRRMCHTYPARTCRTVFDAGTCHAYPARTCVSFASGPYPARVIRIQPVPAGLFSTRVLHPTPYTLCLLHPTPLYAVSPPVSNSTARLYPLLDAGTLPHPNTLCRAPPARSEWTAFHAGAPPHPHSTHPLHPTPIPCALCPVPFFEPSATERRVVYGPWRVGRKGGTTWRGQVGGRIQ